MVMLRSFLPVGQGAFYCEQFGHGCCMERINIVYDCGSATDLKLVEEQIRNNFEKNETIHALFISHLDEDHVNGIPYLLKYCKVEKMFFPLITSVDAEYMRVYNLVKMGMSNLFSVHFLENPYRAFAWLNVEYIPRLYQIRGDDQRENSRIDAIPVLSGVNVSNVVFGNVLEGCEIYKKWLYIPYNFRNSERIEQLQRELEKEFGQDMDNENLQEIWQNGGEEDRKKIKNAYAKIKGSFNTNSMTLYSGTEEFAVGQYMINLGVRHKGNCCIEGCNMKAVGCLYMGDYDASGKFKWREFFAAYAEYWDNVGCVQIPHHGSRHNYNRELSKLDAYYIISVGMKNKHQHPHSIVLKDLLLNGNVPYIVTENRLSEIDFWIRV